MENLTEKQKQIIRDIFDEKQARWQKRINGLPVIGPLLGAIGLITLFYGVEKFLDQTLLVDHPFVMITSGALILLLTGAFYRKL